MIVGGEFVLDHERVPLDLDLPEFRGRLLGRREGGVAGHLSFEPGRLKMGSAPELMLGTEIDLVVNRGVVDIQGARVYADNINLAYHGRIRLAGRPQGQLSLEGPVDLAVLERHVFRSGLGFAGAARFAGLLSIDGSRLRIEGRMQGADGRFLGASVPRFASWLSYDGTSGLVMRELDVATLGGTACSRSTSRPPPRAAPSRSAGACRTPTARECCACCSAGASSASAPPRPATWTSAGRRARPAASPAASLSRSPSARTAACRSPAASTGAPRRGGRPTSDSSSAAVA